ncbi:LytR/AlgR family response regulator transcription factor [Inconstantimicrobium porci]|uniref:LytR/AlgR family response regulator transcription factor n=1 Tax=Inconstantimicrobium porci TaxID=2652291 RepID=UPI002409DE09|nr:LytTR family DNA-binding domain-containing protein [Inconstantimicrobium porci]MDD6769633.1 LytTR family DNA-binding domain-containing protein [Inconstantimicrobium porci]
MKIIICEDDLSQRKNLENIITNEINASNFNICLSTGNPYEVINFVENNYTESFIYFFDVDLGHSINGIELAKRVRKYDSLGYIIFLTAHAELTMLTFQYKVRAMDYILKVDTEIIKSKIADCFKQICEDISNKKKSNMLPIQIGSNIELVNVDNILFFETANTEHKIRIHTTTGYSEFYGTLKDLQAMLPPYFYKPHRSYIVNTKMIKSVDKQSLIIHMKNDEICYVASRYLKGLLSKCSR